MEYLLAYAPRIADNGTSLAQARHSATSGDASPLECGHRGDATEQPQWVDIVKKVGTRVGRLSAMTPAFDPKKQFSVPKNFYLLGLMETADRSL
jgi:hypothetical protein